MSNLTSTKLFFGQEACLLAHASQKHLTLTSCLLKSCKACIFFIEHEFLAILTIRCFGNMLAQVLESNFLKSLLIYMIVLYMSRFQLLQFEIRYSFNYKFLNAGLFSHYSKPVKLCLIQHTVERTAVRQKSTSYLTLAYSITNVTCLAR